MRADGLRANVSRKMRGGGGGENVRKQGAEAGKELGEPAGKHAPKSGTRRGKHRRLGERKAIREPTQDDIIKERWGGKGKYIIISGGKNGRPKHQPTANQRNPHPPCTKCKKKKKKGKKKKLAGEISRKKTIWNHREEMSCQKNIFFKPKSKKGGGGG